VSSAEARDQALVALYEADQRRQEPDVSAIPRRAAEMTSGVWAERDALDSALGETATGWRVERMPPVDRNVLRLALWELRHRPGTPVAVVISEAVRLAKTYSTARSGGFVNGVLARLVGERAAGES
jgi:N utilization substance protein B